MCWIHLLDSGSGAGTLALFDRAVHDPMEGSYEQVHLWGELGGDVLAFFQR